jgi:hypothetical protein
MRLAERLSDPQKWFLSVFLRGSEKIHKNTVIPKIPKTQLGRSSFRQGPEHMPQMHLSL